MVAKVNWSIDHIKRDDRVSGICAEIQGLGLGVEIESMLREDGKGADASDVAQAMRGFIKDFIIAFTAFIIISGSFNVEQSNAFPAPLPAELTLPHILGGHSSAPITPSLQVVAFAPRSPFANDALPSRQSILLLLSLVLATLTAFNLAVWRHLRRVYASPRRGTWGRR